MSYFKRVLLPFFAFFLSSFFSESYLERAIADAQSDTTDKEAVEKAEAYLKKNIPYIVKALEDGDVEGAAYFFAVDDWEKQFGTTDDNLTNILKMGLLLDIVGYELQKIVKSKVTDNFIMLKALFQKNNGKDAIEVEIILRRPDLKIMDIGSNGFALIHILKAQKKSRDQGKKSQKEKSK
ncbi:MAG: hypothetical protein LBJ92_01745 [Holosporales bacterium]|jgi:hypothetical protein|nr:hypothetical protein [Holosporales bacterium]